MTSDSSTGGSADSAHQTVWVPNDTSRRSKVYHTDTECHHNTENHVEKSLSVVSGDFSECEWCSGDFTPPASNHRRSLEGLIASGEVEIDD